MNNRRTIITVGMFDGVHRGHRYLLEQLDRLANNLGMQAGVVTFDKHPLSIINPEKAPKLIYSLEDKYAHLDSPYRKVFLIESTPDLFKLSARDFILALKKSINIKAILMGYNNGFGSDKIKNPEDLQEVLKDTDIEVYTLDKYDKMDVSSSAIRRAIETGDIESARRMLGTFFSIKGKVVKGKQNGTKIGYPTANIDVDETMLVPGTGVYAGLCLGCPAMINIGTAPTLRKDGTVTIEAHIITGHNINDEKVETGNLYGKDISVYMLKKMRDEKKYDSVEALKKQLDEDCKKAIEIVVTLCNTQIPMEK